MISIKTQRELEVMRKACKITAAARALAGKMVRPGVTTGQIDKAVHDSRSTRLSFTGFPETGN